MIFKIFFLHRLTFVVRLRIILTNQLTLTTSLVNNMRNRNFELIFFICLRKSIDKLAYWKYHTNDKDNIKENLAMKMCHSEVIKFIKELENKKHVLLRQESNDCTYTYQDENAKIVPSYSYKATRKAVDELDTKIRKLRHALAVANCSVMVDEFNVTIGEALVMLAQYQNKCDLLSDMSSRQQIAQRSTYSGKMDITCCNYDVATALKDYENLRLVINRLQVAIDRANLTNFVEVEG